MRQFQNSPTQQNRPFEAILSPHRGALLPQVCAPGGVQAAWRPL